MQEAERRKALREAGKPLSGYVRIDNVDCSDAILTTASFRQYTVVIPWSWLVSDNDKYGAALRKRDKYTHPDDFTQRRSPRLVLSAQYRDAKKRIAAEAVKQLPEGAQPFTGPVMVQATLIEPNRSRGRDVTNFCKLTHDALIGVCYKDDAQIDDAYWSRGAPDIDRPRLELTITELDPR